MKLIPRILALAALAGGLALAGGPASAESSDDDAASPKVSSRSDRLDIYGVGMCHQCEWRPRAKLMAAGDQCGLDGNGKPKAGLFECGRNPACDTVCNFVSCEGQ